MRDGWSARSGPNCRFSRDIISSAPRATRSARACAPSATGCSPKWRRRRGSGRIWWAVDPGRPAMRILAIVRDVALIVCAITLTVTTLYFANEYRALRADLAALRALPSELRERVRDRIEGTGDRLRDKAGGLQGRAQDRADK